MLVHVDAEEFLKFVIKSHVEPVRLWRASKYVGYVQEVVLDRAEIYVSHYSETMFVRSADREYPFSLRDSNVIKNDYNDSYLFDTEEAARQHAGL